MELYICGDPNRSSRYTTVPHAEIGAPDKRWTVYINKHHTDYVPLGNDESDRAARAMELGRKFGIRPMRRVKSSLKNPESSSTHYQVRVPKEDLQKVPEWDGTFLDPIPVIY